MSRRSMTLSGDSAWGGRKRKKDEMDLDITPMIDVTFLLLIFFMVASTMQATPDLSVPAATHGGNVDRDYAVTFFITTGESRGAPPVIRDGKNTPHTMEEMAAKAKAAFDAGKTKLIIRADGRVPAGFIDDVLKAVKDVPNIHYAVGVRQKRY